MAASLYDILTVEDKQYYRMNKDIIKKEDVPESILEVLTPENVVDENGLFVVDNKADEAQAPTEANLEEIGASKPAANKPEAGTEPEETKSDDHEEEDDDSTEDSETDDATDEDSEEDQGDSAPAKAPESKPQAPAKPQRAPAPEPVAPFRSKVPQSRPGMGFPRMNGKTVDIFDGKTPHTHLKLVDGVPVPLSAESFRSKSELQIRQRLEELGINTINFEEKEQQQAQAAANGSAGNADTLMLDEDESDDDPTPDQ